MKKQNLRFTLLLLLVVIFSRDVLAADITNPVKLNVNVKKLTNRLYYTNTAKADISVNLGWTEKMMLGETGEIAISVTIAALATVPKTGDLIIKVDRVYPTSDEMKVLSYWLKYNLTGTSAKSIELVEDKGSPTGVPSDVVDKSKLSTLCLKTTVAPGTIYLFDFFPNEDLDGHIIFTAILVDDASLDDTAQVLGVDVQSVYFNYTGATASNPAFWLDLITSATNYYSAP